MSHSYNILNEEEFISLTTLFQTQGNWNLGRPLLSQRSAHKDGIPNSKVEWERRTDRKSISISLLTWLATIRPLLLLSTISSPFLSLANLRCCHGDGCCFRSLFFYVLRRTYLRRRFQVLSVPYSVSVRQRFTAVEKKVWMEEGQKIKEKPLWKFGLPKKKRPLKSSLCWLIRPFVRLLYIFSAKINYSTLSHGVGAVTACACVRQKKNDQFTIVAVTLSARRHLDISLREIERKEKEWKQLSLPFRAEREQDFSSLLVLDGATPERERPLPPLQLAISTPSLHSAFHLAGGWF